MFYFKKIYLPNCTAPQLEAALRKAALKRTSPLDFASAVSDIGTDKYFIGYQGKTDLTFTRIKASPEKLLPKLIIKLSPNAGYYQVRFSIVSMMMFLLFTLPWLLIIALLISGNGEFGGLLTLVGFYAFYWLLLLFEFKLTTWRVKKALLNYDKEPVQA